LERFIALLRAEKVKSYLEIGVRLGNTFDSVVRALPLLERAVAIDLEIRPEMIDVVCKLHKDFPNCQFNTIQGDSGERNVALAALSKGDFDAIFIDGDHRYNWVRTDWLFYGPHGRLVAFHDIAKEPGWKDRDGVSIEVPRFWGEIRDRFRQRWEFVSPRSFKGIGVIKRSGFGNETRPFNTGTL
jgi:predicted O-methyltransferase YrrM